MKRVFPILLFFPFAVLALDGTGSVDFDSAIVPLLNQNTTFKEFVLCNFDIVSDPMGGRIGDIQSKALGGSRIGPYSMWANWRGNSGAKPVILTINTYTDFIDAAGNIVKGNLKKAVRIKEHIDSVTIEPPDKDQPESVPGGLKHAVDVKACAAKSPS
ncbi:hypothetical protein M3I53_06395 [Paraburkholderia sp. CNPSo 3272]|uniref:hypothetical protein n=1 Tax=Paraburkholderia sp. CNPSo 3272 TaxID=2940931 RepID=UPI0020B6CF18|nr:hypothetical protein [Paraburkholderia sp. CNPSo 3272]MCP3722764.1 hypothetical protein [Paraburkholderia sp. CNPSo 3272]